MNTKQKQKPTKTPKVIINLKKKEGLEELEVLWLKNEGFKEPASSRWWSQDFNAGHLTAKSILFLL